MMPGQIPDPSLTAGALPGLGPLTGLPGTALTAQELKCTDIRNIGAMISPLQFLEVKLGKRPQPVKSEVSVGACWLQVALQGCCLHLPGFPSCPCLAVVAGWPAVCFITCLFGAVNACWQLLHWLPLLLACFSVPGWQWEPQCARPDWCNAAIVSHLNSNPACGVGSGAANMSLGWGMHPE